MTGTERAQLTTLADIDQTIDAVVSARGSQREERLGQFGAAVLSHRSGEFQIVGSPLDVFDAARTREDRRFLAICLLTLLSRSREVFDEQRFRVATLKLFDEVLIDDVYKLARIKKGDQGYAKLDALADLVPAAERAFEDAIVQIAEHPSFTAARSEILKTLRSARVAPMLSPFTGRLATPSRLDPVLAAVQEFETADGEPFIDAHRRAQLEIAAYKADAEQLATPQAALLAKLATMLELRVAARYESSGIHEGASIRLEPSLKKYPLHAEGGRINLLVDVTNDGPGYAFDLQVAIDRAEGVRLLDTAVVMGNFSPRTATISFGAEIAAGGGPAEIYAVAQWIDANGEKRQIDDTLALPHQDARVDWQTAQARDPYALEPVSTEEELVGRDDILQALESMMTGDPLGSAIIRGQKRVGKTSIARALASRLDRGSTEIATAFLEVGPFGGDSIASTIKYLAPQICRALTAAVPGATELDIPKFDDGSASGLIGFIDELRAFSDGKPFLLVLDEFDELPPLLFGADDLARSFFMTLRAISSQRDFGVILIGGEKMEFALALHGDALNKFNDRRVDYVELRDNLGEFAKLVRAPSAGVLDITDDAVARIHEETQGHPYFTKVVCRALWSHAIASRDAHVTVREAEGAIASAVTSAATTSFQHFWSDGIRGSAEEQATVSLERRKLFIALAEALRVGDPATEEEIVRQAQRLEMSRSQAMAVVKECVQRDVLVPSGDSYAAKIPFFARWLREFGPSRIGAQLAGSDVLTGLRQRDEQLRVTATELSQLTDLWGPYQGVPVTSEDVRAWLDQFIGPEAQRLMFKILQNVRFYGGATIADRLMAVHASILGTEMKRQRGSLERHDVLVSYLDGAGKSGPTFASRYRSVNQIAYDNVVERAELEAAILDRPPRVLVFVDDFVGTGASVSESIAELPETLMSLLVQKKVSVGYACVAGLTDGLKAVQQAFRDRGVARPRVNAGDELSSADCCFTKDSRVFVNELERLRAEQIAADKGKELEPDHPLGFHDSQAAVVFETRCPNNSLPILWAERGGWRPLFPRH